MSRPTTPVKLDQNAELINANTVGQPAETSSEAKAKQRKPRAAESLTREPGRSLLPYARVQKILKADKELIMVQREAAFLISCATEHFIRRIAEAAQRVAERERRTTVQAKDLVASVRRADEFAFLEELLPYLEPELAAQASGRRKPRAEQDGGKGKSTLLDQYIKKPAVDDDQDGDQEDGPAMNIVMNEDGTMVSVPTEVPP